MDRPTSTARSWAHARERQGDDLHGEHHARPDERGRRPPVASARQRAPHARSRRRGGRATSSTSSTPSRDQPAEPEQALQLAEVARPVELGAAEVRCDAETGSGSIRPSGRSSQTAASATTTATTTAAGNLHRRARMVRR